MSKVNETNKDSNNQSSDTNEFDEHNYIKTKTNACSLKIEAISELKDMITTKYTEFDQKYCISDFFCYVYLFIDLYNTLDLKKWKTILVVEKRCLWIFNSKL